jgi:hypothetical protein
MGCGCNYNGCVVQDMICYMRMRFVIPWLAVWITAHMWDHATLVLGDYFVEPCPLMRRLTDKSSQPVVVFV